MEKLKIGKIVGTHALKGELKIRSFSDFNDQRFVVGHKLYLNEIVDPFIIKTVRVHKGNYLISFEGLQDINLVEKYVGYNVYGLKEDVELDDDEYFYDDLIGCQIINNDQEIGKVESVYFNGAHDVLTVQTANKKIAIPYVDAFIENEDIVASLEFWGAYEDDELRGVIATNENRKHICCFFVKSKYHRQGIGRKLWECVLDNSNHPIYTVNSSPYAVPVYHKLGFIDMDSEQLADGMRFTPMKFERYRDNGIQN